MAKPLAERITKLEAEMARTEAFISRLTKKTEKKRDQLQKLYNHKSFKQSEVANA